MKESLVRTAYDNLQELSKKKYLGRMIVLGRLPDGRYIIAYAVTGRSPESRNRKFELTPAGIIRTAVADNSEVKGDPALTIYEALMASPDGKLHIVSNGAQTKYILARYTNEDLSLILGKWDYEPDPNHTPRISGLIDMRDDSVTAAFAINRKAKNSDATELKIFTPKFERGFGHFMSTYDDDNPDGLLPAFSKEPILVPMEGSPAEIEEICWGMLGVYGHQVCMVTQIINPDGTISSVSVKNQYAEDIAA